MNHLSLLNTIKQYESQIKIPTSTQVHLSAPLVSHHHRGLCDGISGLEIQRTTMKDQALTAPFFGQENTGEIWPAKKLGFDQVQKTVIFRRKNWGIFVGDLTRKQSLWFDLRNNFAEMLHFTFFRAGFQQ